MMPSPRPRSTRQALAGLQYALGTVAPANPLVFAWRWRYELILGIGMPAALAVLGGIPVMLGTLAAITVAAGAALDLCPDPALPHRARMVHHHTAQGPRRLRAGVDPLAPRQDPRRAAHHPSALRRASAPMVPSRDQRHRLQQCTAAADSRLLGPRHPGQWQ